MVAAHWPTFCLISAEGDDRFVDDSTYDDTLDLYIEDDGAVDTLAIRVY